MDLNKTDPQPLTVKDLTGAHLGKTVTLRSSILGVTTGTLAGVDHSADIISNLSLRDPDHQVLGRTRTAITLLGWGSTSVSPDTRVEVHP